MKSYNNNSLKILVNKYAVASLIFLAIHQAMIASTTLWLSQIFTSISEKGSFLLPAILYISFLILSHIPWVVASILLTKWGQSSQLSFIREFSKMNSGSPKAWTSKSIKEQRHPFLCNDGPAMIDGSISYFFDMANTSFNVIFNVGMIIYVVDSLFIVGYVISLILAVCITKLSKKRISILSTDVQNSSIDLNNNLINSWDNIIISNTYNFKLWLDETIDKFNINYKNNVKYAHLINILSNGSEIIISIPILITFGCLIYTHSEDYAYLAILFATLSRQSQILTYVSVVVSHVFSWVSYSAQFKKLFEILTPIKAVDISGRVKWGSITTYSSVNKKTSKLESLQDLSESTEKYSNGYYTIRGDNGTGKSTTLLMVKSNNLDNSYYLPSHHNLTFASLTSTGLSTGQKLIKIIDEISENIKVNIFLLDEWDANLDQKNIEIIQEKLTRLSKSMCIIEVRHRSETSESAHGNDSCNSLEASL